MRNKWQSNYYAIISKNLQKVSDFFEEKPFHVAEHFRKTFHSLKILAFV